MKNSSVYTTKILRRLHLAKHLDLVMLVDSTIGNLKIPMQRGLTEHLLIAPIGGFKADLLRIIESHGLFTGVICDVGLNQGQTLLELYGTGLPIENYYGFEPNSQAFSIAERLVTLNPSFSSATLFPWACSNQNEPLALFRLSEVDSGSTLTPDIRPDLYTEMSGDLVPSYRLDTVVHKLNLKTHFFLKIDVEGGELEVLKGANETINTWRPVIQCEVLHAHRSSELAENNQHKSQLIDFLNQSLYTLFMCRLSSTDQQLVSLEQLERFPSAVYSDSPHTCDYLFVPQEIASSFIA